MGKYLLHRNFGYFWTGQAVSGLGTWIDFVALNLYAYSLFNSANVLGSFLVARLLPAMLFGPLGGYLADKFSRRSLLIASDISRGILILGFIFTKDITTFFILGTVLAAVDKIAQAVQGAYIPDLVHKSQLMQANALMRMATSVMTVLGPAVGAVLVSTWGFKYAFIIDSATFFFSAIALFAISPIEGKLYVFDENTCNKEDKKDKKDTVTTSPGKPAEKSAPDSDNINSNISTWAFLVSAPLLLFLFAVRLIDSTGSGTFQIALPIFGSKMDSLGSGAAYGWLIGIWALGTLLGNFGLTKYMKKWNLPPGEIFTFSVILMAVSLAAVFQTKTLWPALIFIFISGLGDGLSGLLFQTTLMQLTPNCIRGKVVGTSLALMQSGSAIGMAIAGPFIESLGMGVFTNYAALIIIAGTIICYLCFKTYRVKEQQK